MMTLLMEILRDFLFEFLLKIRILGEMTIFDALWMHAEVNKKKRCARRWRVAEEIDRLMSNFLRTLVELISERSLQSWRFR